MKEEENCTTDILDIIMLLHRTTLQPRQQNSVKLSGNNTFPLVFERSNHKAPEASAAMAGYQTGSPNVHHNCLF